MAADCQALARAASAPKRFETASAEPPKDGWTVLVIVGVGGKHMHCIVVQQPQGDPPGDGSPVAG